MADKAELKKRAAEQVKELVAQFDEMAAQAAEQRMAVQGAGEEIVMSDEEWEERYDLAMAQHLRKTGMLN